jgi:hypothetical protein
MLFYLYCPDKINITNYHKERAHMLNLSKIEKTIQVRTSCRRYLRSPIGIEDRQKLAHMIHTQTAAPLGSHTRFLLTSAAEEDRHALKGLGTYGYILGATGFIIGAVETAPHDMEDYGYQMEAIILFATQLGLGTCWLGGTFTSSRFARKINLTDTETLPAATATGMISAKRHPLDYVRRQRNTLDRRFPWQELFFDTTFSTPLLPEAAEAYARPLEMVRLAPSASNKQPWRIVKKNNHWHFYLTRTPNYPPAFLKLADLQRVDIGIAMCHFALTAESLELKGCWDIHEPANITPQNSEYIISWVSEK